MKKSLLFLASAALVLASCNNDVKLDENVALADSNAQKEIALTSYAQGPKRVKANAPIDGTDFTPTTIKVAAYDVTNNREFFAPTDFTNPAGDGTGTWKGGKYWPLAVDTVNFLAYAELTTAGTPALVWGATGTTATWTLVMSDNKSAQNDLMYAIGTGGVKQNADNTLTFPGDITMQFKHAQAWISFYAETSDDDYDGVITLDSIMLNGAKYNGTFTVTHTNYNATSGQSVAGVWSALGSTANVKVPGWNAATLSYDGSGAGDEVGDGLMIVPDDNNTTADWTSFTIYYRVDGKAYNYTYTPTTAAAANVDQAKHYIFNISITLHEIEIAAEVIDWDDQTPVAVPVG